MADINFQELAQKVVEQVKNNPEKLKAITENSDLVKEILGDDGKLSKDDLDRVVQLVKSGEGIKDLGQGLLDSVKGLF